VISSNGNETSLDVSLSLIRNAESLEMYRNTPVFTSAARSIADHMRENHDFQKKFPFSIIETLLSNIEPGGSGMENDPTFFTALSRCPRGCVIQALLEYIKRELPTDQDDKAWDEIRPILEKELKKCQDYNWGFFGMIGSIFNFTVLAVALRYNTKNLNEQRIG